MSELAQLLRKSPGSWKNPEQALLDEAATELDRLTAEVAGLKADAQAKQAHIDRLMLEYCPSEMTTEQIFEWGRNQVSAAQEPTAQEQK